MVDLGTNNDDMSRCSNSPKPSVMKIIAKPSDYYVAVETATQPNGAAKGMLKGED